MKWGQQFLGISDVGRILNKFSERGVTNYVEICIKYVEKSRHQGKVVLTGVRFDLSYAIFYPPLCMLFVISHPLIPMYVLCPISSTHPYLCFLITVLTITK